MQYFSDDPDEPFDLPEGCDQIKLEEISNQLSERAARLGLYMAPLQRVMLAGDPPEQHLFLETSFRIGSLAYKPRVQNPEGEVFEDQFRQIEAGMVEDQKQSILDQYRKKSNDADAAQADEPEVP